MKLVTRGSLVFSEEEEEVAVFPCFESVEHRGRPLAYVDDAACLV